MTRKSSSLVGRFRTILGEASRSLRKAKGNRHSLAGTGYYARAYWEKIGELRHVASSITAQLESRGLQEEADLLCAAIERVVTIQTSVADAEGEIARVRKMWVLRLEPSLQPSASRKKSDKLFFPPELRRSVPGFLRPVFEQIQGCYAYEFRDAALVMLRKLVESLIIEGYERRGRGSEIKKNGNYLQFGDLVGMATSGMLFRLSRDSKTAIEGVKTLGHNAAHGPRFHARQSEVDELRKGARILLEDILKTIEGSRTTAS